MIIIPSPTIFIKLLMMGLTLFSTLFTDAHEVISYLSDALLAGLGAGLVHSYPGWVVQCSACVVWQF